MGLDGREVPRLAPPPAAPPPLPFPRRPREPDWVLPRPPLPRPRPLPPLAAALSISAGARPSPPGSAALDCDNPGTASSAVSRTESAGCTLRASGVTHFFRRGSGSMGGRGALSATRVPRRTSGVSCNMLVSTDVDAGGAVATEVVVTTAMDAVVGASASVGGREVVAGAAGCDAAGPASIPGAGSSLMGGGDTAPARGEAEPMLLRLLPGEPGGDAATGGRRPVRSSKRHNGQWKGISSLRTRCRMPFLRSLNKQQI